MRLPEQKTVLPIRCREQDWVWRIAIMGIVFASSRANALIALVASYPFITGICTSIKIASNSPSGISEDRVEPKNEELTDIDSSNLEGLHFLAAEDNEINAEILEEILKIERPAFSFFAANSFS